MITRYREVDGKLRHINGWRPEAETHRFGARTPTAATPPAIASLPRRVDLSDRWPAIKDQGVIGDCVANATLECYEFFQPLGARRPLSRLYLYAYGRLAEGTPLTEDSGMQVGTALEVLTERGAPYEEDWDYADYGEKFAQQLPVELDVQAAEHRALYWYPCPDLFTLKASLAQGFPAAFGFRCPENMFSAACLSTGLIHYPEPGEGYAGAHATGIAGYDDDIQIGDDVGVLILPNSWGTGVGQSGYFLLPQRFVTEGIAASIYSLRHVLGALDKETGAIKPEPTSAPYAGAGSIPELRVPTPFQFPPRPHDLVPRLA